jgi:alpha-galactosidase
MRRQTVPATLLPFLANSSIELGAPSGSLPFERQMMHHFRADAADATLFVACEIGKPARILYWGRRLSDGVTVDELEDLATRQGANGAPGINVAASLALEPGLGLLGPSGLSAHRAGMDWGSLFEVDHATKTENGCEIRCSDPRTRLSLIYDLEFDPDAGVFKLGTTLANDGHTTLDLVEMATACLPIPQPMTEIIGFTGRWAMEFQRERIPRHAGAYMRENRRGRTSHDSFPAVILCTQDTNEQSGEAYALHLAWSGNHRIRVDTLSDGRVFASLGALLLPGEIRLEPGETYASPKIVACYSSRGLSALSQRFHQHVRTGILAPAMQAKPRPVHYNTWEAVYFDHDVERLKELATRAAAIGVERFVLDDGWFGARRHDSAGLGDWTVSKDVYPEGLKPIVDHVTGLGMEMGIWFEPEMVNPDSDLYRAHPDWVLEIAGIPQMPFRNQYVLDIARPEVSDYLFGKIDAILSEYAIGYIKWDMNRDLSHPGDVAGRPRAYAQVAALYALLERLRTMHPDVEIESCASGGGRADYGVLAHTDRVWTSDTNDAIDRQAIQRGASFFLPLEVMGAHVGPHHCHITGRRLPMAMRAATAMFGHMGLELNLLDEPLADLAELKTSISLYKEHRNLLHSGDFVRLETPGYLNAVGVISRDMREALFSVAYLTGHVAVLPDRLYFCDLDADGRYQVRLIWPQNWTSIVPPSIIETLDLGGKGADFSGGALMFAGLQLPLAHPETVFLFHVVAV